MSSYSFVYRLTYSKFCLWFPELLLNWGLDLETHIHTTFFNLLKVTVCRIGTNAVRCSANAESKTHGIWLWQYALEIIVYINTVCNQNTKSDNNNHGWWCMSSLLLINWKLKWIFFFWHFSIYSPEILKWRIISLLMLFIKLLHSLHLFLQSLSSLFSHNTKKCHLRITFCLTFEQINIL